MVVDWFRFLGKSDSSVMVVVVVMVVNLVVDWFRFAAKSDSSVVVVVVVMVVDLGLLVTSGKQTPARSESERSVRDGPENRKLLVEEPEGEKCPRLTTHH
ncbi:hypothetical protein Pmani_026608 [Petrolisthes manimaculis]|uniref:Uncharacterized protein n=1 Tax=Petrolisthes manimaculis TaxID=1843537 RepID=A0AAE1TX94_9EUCA|nr:hypothetical protein Pmani_026608 [Petrolisthes manimaculis]